METVALFYIIIGLSIMGFAHIGKYGNAYVEKVPVAFRMNSLKRWMHQILKQVKI